MSIKAHDQRDIGAFIPAALDDYGLTPYEFRVYARLVRRAGKTSAYESVANMAIACKLGEQKVKEVLRVLTLAGMITRVARPGKTTIYEINCHSKWVHPEKLDEVRQEAGYHRSAQVLRTPRCPEHPGVENTYHPGVENTYHPGVENTYHPGVENTYEGITRKVPHEGTPMKDKKDRAQTAQTEPERSEPASSTSTVNPVPCQSDRLSEVATVGQDQNSAPAPRNSSAAQNCDRAFQKFPWGYFSDPDKDFIGYLQRVHLPANPGYRDRVPTKYQALQWFNAAKYEDKRLDNVHFAWQEYQEWKQKLQQNQQASTANVFVAPPEEERDPEEAQRGREILRAAIKAGREKNGLSN